MEAFGLAISITALFIAIYGIFERQRAAYSSVRVRLTELLGDIESVKLEEYRYEDEQQDPTGPGLARSGFVSRRALLTYQALDLTRRLESAARWISGRTSTLTPSEYGALAYALQWCDDFGEAEEYWQKSIDVHGFASAYVLAANHRGYAGLLFDLHRADEGRAHYERAINYAAGEADTQRWDALFTYVSWISHEIERVEAGEPGIPDEVVDRARSFAATARYLEPMMQIEISNAATTTVFADGEYRDKRYGSANEATE